MQAAIEKFQTIGFMRGGRISGFDGQRTPFYISKRLVEVSRIDEEGRPTRVAQWLIELEAPVDPTALLRHDEDPRRARASRCGCGQRPQGHGGGTSTVQVVSEDGVIEVASPSPWSSKPRSAASALPARQPRAGWRRRRGPSPARPPSRSAAKRRRLAGRQRRTPVSRPRRWRGCSMPPRRLVSMPRATSATPPSAGAKGWKKPPVAASVHWRTSHLPGRRRRLRREGEGRARGLGLSAVGAARRRYRWTRQRLKPGAAGRCWRQVLRTHTHNRRKELS